MGLDPLSTIAPARVKVLVLPVGRITASKFLSYVDRLRQENVVRLGDVSPDDRPHRSISTTNLYGKPVRRLLMFVVQQQCSRL